MSTQSLYQWKITEDKLTFRPDLAGCYTLDEVAARLRSEYHGWFVYQGAHHVALHRRENDDRLLLVTEAS